MKYPQYVILLSLAAGWFCALLPIAVAAGAKKFGGNGLMLFDAAFEARLAQSFKEDLQELAPMSVHGF